MKLIHKIDIDLKDFILNESLNFKIKKVNIKINIDTNPDKLIESDSVITIKNIFDIRPLISKKRYI